MYICSISPIAKWEVRPLQTVRHRHVVQCKCAAPIPSLGVDRMENVAETKDGCANVIEGCVRRQLNHVVWRYGPIVSSNLVTFSYT